MDVQLTCAWCMLKNKMRSDRPAVTLLAGTALCRDHLIEYQRTLPR